MVTTTLHYETDEQGADDDQITLRQDSAGRLFWKNASNEWVKIDTIKSVADYNEAIEKITIKIVPNGGNPTIYRTDGATDDGTPSGGINWRYEGDDVKLDVVFPVATDEENAYAWELKSPEDPPVRLKVIVKRQQIPAFGPHKKRRRGLELDCADEGSISVVCIVIGKDVSPSRAAAMVAAITGPRR